MSTTTTIDLQAWCDNEQSRFNLRAPFVQDGWLYATNGCWAIRIPSDQPNSEGKLPKMQPIFDRFASEFVDLPLDATMETAIKECPACEGDGFDSDVMCSTCDGNGSIACDSCGNEEDCEDCWGEGSHRTGTCQTCDGKKRFEQPSHISLLGAHIAAKAYDLLRQLPNAQIAVEKEYRLFARFDGGEAIVMQYLPRGYE